jgi:hypothetical protein
MKTFLYGAPISVFLLTSWLLLVSVTVFAQTDHTHAPATAEDCTKLTPALQAVVGAMDAAGLKIEAVAKPESMPAIEPSGQKLEVALRPLSEVAIIAGKTKPGESLDNVFGGFVPLNVPKDGMYRISADRTLWIEVIEGEKPIERVRIAPRLHCGKIQKSLGFPLKRERSYWLELSGSKLPDVAVIITQEPKG